MNTLDNLSQKLEEIKLQITSAKDSAEDIYLLKSTVSEVEMYIQQSLTSLNHLIDNINDYKTTSLKK